MNLNCLVLCEPSLFSMSSFCSRGPGAKLTACNNGIVHCSQDTHTHTHMQTFYLHTSHEFTKLRTLTSPLSGHTHCCFMHTITQLWTAIDFLFLMHSQSVQNECLGASAAACRAPQNIKAAHKGPPGLSATAAI